MKNFFIGFIVLCTFSLGHLQASAGVMDVISNAVGGIAGNAAENIANDLLGEGPVPDGSFQVGSYRGAVEEGIAYNTSVRQYILRVVNFALAFVGLLATVMVIYGGFRYITSQGDDVDAAKKTILYSAIGILVILISFALVNTLITQAPKGGGDELDDPGNIEASDMSDITIDADKPIVKADAHLLTASAEGLVDIGNGFAVPFASAKEQITFEFAGNYSAVAWDFGDQMRSTKNPTTHKYGKEFLYTITVVGETDEAYVLATKRLVVGGVHARATIDNVNPKVGEPVQFDAQSSITAMGTIDEYTWTCEQIDGDIDGCFEEKTGEKPQLSFSAPGTYSVSLTVLSSIGLSDTQGVELTVTDTVPTAQFSVSSTNNPRLPGEYRFDARASKNVEGKMSGLRYLWDFDGEQRETSLPVLRYEFDSNGDKFVMLQVSQEIDGRTVVSDVAEEYLLNVQTFGVDFDTPSGSIFTGEDVAFDAKSNNADSFEWSFPSSVDFISGDSSSASVVVQFTEKGRFDVSLTGGRGDDVSQPIQKTVYVQQALETSDDDEEQQGDDASTVDDGDGTTDDTDTSPQPVVGEPLAVIDVQYKGAPILTGSEVERNEDGVPMDLVFRSASFDTQGNKSPDADLDETWSVNGDIVVGGAEAIPALLKEVGSYTIQLLVSVPGNANIRDRQDFRIRVINTPPKKVSAIPHITPKKKEIRWADTLLASSFSEKLVVDDLTLSFDDVVNEENKNGFVVRVDGISDIDGGHIDRYEFRVVGQGVPASTQVVSDPIAYFDLDSSSFSGKDNLKFQVRIYDNDGDFVLIESQKSFSVYDFDSVGDVLLHDLDVSIYLSGSSQSNTIREGEWMMLSAEAFRGDKKLSLPSANYTWTLSEDPSVSFRNNKVFQRKFEKTGTYTIHVDVTDNGDTVSDDYTVIVLPADDDGGGENEESSEDIAKDALDDLDLAPEEIENILDDLQDMTKDETRDYLQELGMDPADIDRYVAQKKNEELAADEADLAANRYTDEATCEASVEAALAKLPQSAQDFLLETLKGCALLEALDDIAGGKKPTELVDIPGDVWESIKKSDLFGVPEKIASLIDQRVKHIPLVLSRIQVNPYEKSFVNTKFELGLWGFTPGQTKYFRFDWDVVDPDGKQTSFPDDDDRIIFIPDVPGIHRVVVEVSNETGSIKSEVGEFLVRARAEEKDIPDDPDPLPEREPEPEPEPEPEREKIVLTPEKRPIKNINPVRVRPPRPGEPVQITPEPPKEIVPEYIERQFEPAAPEIQKKIEKRPMVDSGSNALLPLLVFFAFLTGGGVFLYQRRR